MLQYGEEAEMSDMASVGSVIGPKRAKMEQAAPSGNQPAMLVERSVSPRSQYSPYGTKVSQVEIGASAFCRDRSK